MIGHAHAAHAHATWSLTDAGAFLSMVAVGIFGIVGIAVIVVVVRSEITRRRAGRP